MKRLFIVAVLMLFVPFCILAQNVKEHTVANGETLQGIAAHYKVSISDLKSTNPGLDEYLLPGMVLKIPANKQEVISSNTEVILNDDLKDVIYLKDGSELVAKILTIESDVVKFEQYDTDEPYSISKDKILSITFEDGRVSDFTSSKKNKRRK